MKINYLNIENHQNLVCPPGRAHIEVFDPVLRGFYVDVLASGRKSFRLRYRFNNKLRVVTLGDAAYMSLDDARQAARELLRKAKLGDDPLELLDAVLPRVVSMHASDRYLVPGASLDDLKHAEGSAGYSKLLLHGVTGKGLNNYPEIFRRLSESGYSGWISIEDGMNGMEEMRASLLFLGQMVDTFYPICD